MEHLKTLIGKTLTDFHFACDMMMFTFEEYELHAQCLTRVVRDADILFTTLDYQSWDHVEEAHNDAWYFAEKYKASFLDKKVASVDITDVGDVFIHLQDALRIDLLASGGYHHYNAPMEQWVFFKCGDQSFPFVTAYSKTVDVK